MVKTIGISDQKLIVSLKMSIKDRFNNLKTQFFSHLDLFFLNCYKNFIKVVWIVTFG